MLRILLMMRFILHELQKEFSCHNKYLPITPITIARYSKCNECKQFKISPMKCSLNNNTCYNNMLEIKAILIWGNSVVINKILNLEIVHKNENINVSIIEGKINIIDK